MPNVKLSEYEKKMLAGEFGRLKQICMENVVKYADALGAKELCVVTKAHICGGYTCLSFGHDPDYHETFRKSFLSTEEKVHVDPNIISPECYAQTDVGSCDFLDYKPMNHTKELFDKNWEFLKNDVEMGVTVMGSCTPYLTGWVPLRGEHFVTTESSNVLMSNSVFGACGNADGSEAVMWSAITGRTPKWGNHILENRYGTVVYQVHFPVNTRKDWDVLGYTVGRKLKLNQNPVIHILEPFDQVTIAKLKQLFATMATTSGAELCHIVGVTPEAPTVQAALGNKEPAEVIDITMDDYNESVSMICDEGSADIQFVSLGCPHYTMEELAHVARELRGKKIPETVKLIVWTNHAIKEAARLSGYIGWIEEAGGHVLSGGCPVVQGPQCYEGVSALCVDAGKQAHYMRSSTNAKIFYGTTDECIKALLAGRWEEVK